MDYTDSLLIAADRIERMGENPEYERGMINLLADLHPIREMDTGERMDMIAHDLRILTGQARPGGTVTTNDVAHVLAAMSLDDMSAQVLEAHAAEDTWTLPAYPYYGMEA